MSLVKHTVSPRQVAANQANGQKSTGPKTDEGKARVSRNALRTGAYAKKDNALREIMLRRGENPEDYDQFYQRLTDGWSPDDLMQEMLVKKIAQKSWDLEQLQAAWRESQLTALHLSHIQALRRDLVSSRWCPGVPVVEPAARGLWQAKDSPSKFKKIYDILDLLQKWFDEQVCPDEYPEAMNALYGECPTLAGERIRLLTIQFFGSDEAGTQKAARELPGWITKERRDVNRERDLFQQEMALRDMAGPILVEQQVNAREAVLEKQIAEHTRLLLQLQKTKRSQRASPGSGNREEGAENREKAIGNREQDQTAVATRPNAGDVASSDPTANATESGDVDVAPAFRPASSTPDASSGSVSGQSAIPTDGQNGDETGVAGVEIAEKR